MAKVTLLYPFESLSGRLSISKGHVVKLFRKTGAMYLVPRRGPDRVRQQQPRNRIRVRPLLYTNNFVVD